MNKKVKQIIAIILAGLLLLSLAVSVFAEEPQSDFKYYFCVCDSLGNKTGGEMGERTDSKGWLANSYPVIVSEYFGLTEDSEHFYGGRAGWRTNEIRYLLDDSFQRDAFANNEDWLKDYGYYTIKYMDNLRPTYRANLQKADLVTVNVGSNDLAGNLLFAAQEVLTYKSVSTPESRAILAKLQTAKEKYSDEELIVEIIDILATAENGVLLMQNCLSAFARIMKNYGSNFDAMMKAIESYTDKDATIVVVGLFNCVGSMIQNKVSIPTWAADMANAALQPVFSYANYCMKYASAYKDTYIFVDVDDADMTGSIDGAHLGLAGHRYFADHIIMAVNSTLPCDHSFGTTVVNYRAPSKLIAGYSGDVKCNHCGEIIRTGSILKPTLLK